MNELFVSYAHQCHLQFFKIIFLQNVFENNFNKKFDVSEGDEVGEMGSTGGRPH